MTTSPDTAAMAIAWSERAKAALDLSRQYLAGANAVIEQDSPVNDPWHAELRTSVYRHQLRIADAYEIYADRCREAAHGCRAFKTTDERDERRHRYDAVPGVYSAEQGGAA